MRFAIVIPTMGISHLENCVESIIKHWRGQGTLVLSFNAKDLDEANKTRSRVEVLCQQAENDYGAENFEYKILWSSLPLGFGRSVNKGITHLQTYYYKDAIDQTIVLNDDTIVTAGWQQSLYYAHSTKKAQTSSLSMLGRDSVDIDMLGGKVGITGACSFEVAGEQNVANEGNIKAYKTMGLDKFAKEYRVQLNGQYLRTDFLSGFCISISQECMNDLIEEVNNEFHLFDERFKIGGFEDNDLCYRAIKAGYQMLIVKDTFIDHKAHSTLNKYYKETLGGLHNRDVFYKKWEEETQRDQKVIGAYRVAFKCVNDLAQFRSSIKRAIQIGLKGFAILLTNNPKEILNSYDSNLLHSLPPEERKFAESLVQCNQEDEIIEAFENYITILTDGIECNLSYTDWKSFNEREERNKTHMLAEKMEADWIFSIDADEVFEDRLTKDHLNRLVKHPDPLVCMYHVSWINHWETMNLVRVDEPFTTGSNLKGSMTGSRLFKTRKNPLRIVSGSEEVGLHCGNSPEYSSIGIRVSNIRFRHLSHVRNIDRLHKKKFYDNIDKEKNPLFLGKDTYDHIIQADDVKVQLYNPANGICGFMLCYEEEETEFIAQKLDLMYGVCDEIVLVWTSEEERSEKLLYLAKMYKVTWLFHKFVEDEGLAECRNKAVEYIRKDLLPKGISWALFYDPDENPLKCSNVQNNASIKRCVELNDTWGYMFTYKNKLPKGSDIAASTSQSIRLFRVDPIGIMKFRSRVHENLDESLKELQANGISPSIKAFPYAWLNLGLDDTPEKMGKKLKSYTNMLVKELEDNQYNGHAWLSLGLQFVNEGDMETAEICFERACMTAGDAYMPFKEMAIIQLNKALGYIVACKERLYGGEKVFWREVDDLIEIIQKGAKPHPIINTGEENIIAGVELPKFDYERITIDESGNFKVTSEDK